MRILLATLASIVSAIAGAGVVAPNEIVLVSTNSFGQPANANAEYPRLAAKGRYAVFVSDASNLALGGTGNNDVFLHDIETGETILASRTSAGAPGNGNSAEPDVSANGRFVAFVSDASNLVSDDTNGKSDVFVFDRKHGTVERVSVGSHGEPSNGICDPPAISGNGRFVAFSSSATNLVAADTNNTNDVFVHDRKTKKTERVSVGQGGIEADGSSSDSAISANGRYVAFYSEAMNLDGAAALAGNFVHDRKTGATTRVSLTQTGEPVFNLSHERCSISANGRVVLFKTFEEGVVPGDQNGTADVFARDRKKASTTRVSVSTDGSDAGDFCEGGSLSGNGRYVSFVSNGAGLVPGDTNGKSDVFVRDLKENTTVRVSLGIGGVQADAPCFRPTLSHDGRTLLFGSFAKNLVSPGTSGTHVFARGL